MSDLGTGVVELERDHHFFTALVSPVEKGRPGSLRLDQLHLLLTEVRQFARTHFRAEESLMLAYGYLESDAHIAEHREMQRKIDVFVAQAEAEALEPAPVDAFLQDWLIRHTTLVDGPMLEHVARARYEEALDT